MNTEFSPSNSVDFTHIRPSGISVYRAPKIELFHPTSRQTIPAVETYINGSDSAVNTFLIDCEEKKGGFGNVHMIVDTQKNQIFALKTIREPDTLQFSGLNPEKFGIDLAIEDLIAKLRKMYGNGNHLANSDSEGIKDDPHYKLYANIESSFIEWQQIRQRFEREADLQTRLDHPNIVKAYRLSKFVDPIQNKESKGMVMELIEGPSLKEYLRYRKLQLPYIQQYVTQIVEANIYLAQKAHPDIAILHNDLKTANVLLQGDQAFVTDFGLATGVFDDWGEHVLAGSLLYMPPERIKGKQPTIPSNTYALGLIVYEMFTNRPLFYKAEEEATLDTLFRIVNQGEEYEAQILALDKELMERGYENRKAMIDFVRKATHKEPEQRFQSFEAFLSAFTDATTQLKESLHRVDQSPPVFDSPMSSATNIFDIAEPEIMNTQLFLEREENQHISPNHGKHVEVVGADYKIVYP